MTQFNRMFMLALASLLALVTLSACVDKDCSREGLKVYTLDQGDNNWVSTCKHGVWDDVLVDDPIAKYPFLKRYADCEAVACYEGEVHDCECIETLDADVYYGNKIAEDIIEGTTGIDIP